MVVARGDSSPGSGSQRLREVNDYRPTEFIASIAAMNRGMDFREAKLLSPTNFCIGATADLGRGVQREARLAYRKITAGAHFLVTQPIFDPTAATRFYEAYADVAGEKLTAPVFFGLQILVPTALPLERYRKRSGESWPPAVRESKLPWNFAPDSAMRVYITFT